MERKQMSTDGDKIAAGTLATALWATRSKSTNPLDHPGELVALYGEVLAQVTMINPDTGKPFTPEEIQRVRLRNQARS
jgi:hypothetical protein